MATETESERGLAFDPGRLARRGISIGALVVGWALLATAGVIPRGMAPTTVAATFAEVVVTGQFWASVVRSTARVYVSFAVALALAVPLGLLIGWSDRFEAVAFPPLEMLRPIPPIAWIPLTILLLPTTVGLVVTFRANILFITGLGAFFPLLLNTIQGVEKMEAGYRRAAESLGADRVQVFRHVVLPAALPAVHTGMVVGMGLAWVNLVAAEMLAGSGIGFMTWSGYTAGNFSLIVVGMITIGALGALSSVLVRRLGDRWLAWQTDAAAE